MRRSGADAGDLGMNRIIVGAVGLIIGGAVGAHAIQLFHPSQHLRRSTATVRKTDNFAASALGQIRADLRQYGVEENPQTYEVYQATGGIGAANPRIVSWGRTGNMAFEVPRSGETYRIEEMAMNPMIWHYVPSDRPIHWQKHLNKSGQVYYGHNFTGVQKYFFKKGSTYIVVVVTPTGPFPTGLIDHLKPVGNPLPHS